MGSEVSTEASGTVDNVHVVVVGGGYGGIACALALKKAGIKFSLVDPKTFFHHNVAALRVIVFPDYAKYSTITFETTFGNSFVQGKVVNIDWDQKRVDLDNGRELTFTHLVIATGSHGAFPSRTSQSEVQGLVAEAFQMAEQISKSSKIVIIGGGAVGIELAGEIKDAYSDKAVTIINSGDELLSAVNLGSRLRSDAKKLLEHRGVNLVLGAETFNDQGRLRVGPDLLVEGYTNVYAIGDACNTDEEKMAAHAETHANLVVENIRRTEFNGMIITVGKAHGVGVVNGWHMPSFVWGLVKGKSLFTSKYWEAMGQKMPS